MHLDSIENVTINQLKEMVSLLRHRFHDMLAIEET